jgi:hypothetical protein
VQAMFLVRLNKVALEMTKGCTEIVLLFFFHKIKERGVCFFTSVSI